MLLFIVRPIIARHKVLLFAAAVVFALASCNSSATKIEPTFYYWKNASWSLSNDEWRCLDSVKAKQLYVKFFEVVPDPLYSAVPSAKSSLQIDQKYELKLLDSLSGSRLEIIPCVFVLNATLKSIRTSYIDTLADNIVFLIKKYYEENYEEVSAGFKEIQIDCDWTESTSAAYFKLLAAIKKKSHVQLSCTLRLYPFAYPKKMGVPPVDRVSLMCYNILNLRKEKERNSILDLPELEKYLKEADDYELPIDVALPLFSWAQVYQHGELVDMIDVSEEFRSKLKHNNGLWYELTEDYEDYKFYLRKGDKVKIEEVSFEQLQKATALVKQHVTLRDGARIALFHLDDNIVNKYSNEQIQAIYNSFHK